MASKNQLKWVRKLHQQKYRQQEGLFLAEGVKVVDELLRSRLEVVYVFATEIWIENNPQSNDDVIKVSPKELETISTLMQPNQVLAVARIPHISDAVGAKKGWSLLLDKISDPGNMGTIIRTADWFGFDHIFVAQHSAEIWNAKVIQAAMGSVFRIPVQVVDNTVKFLESFKERQPVYGMLLDGMPIQQVRFAEPGIVIIGNESKGISPELYPSISHRITIQGADPKGQGRAESLNASLATAIVCYEINRQVNIGK